MKKKTKFIMVAMALCLTVALGVLGIFAVKTLNMTVGGNITFSADGISFVVSDGAFKTITGAEYTGIMTDTTKLKGFEMNTNTTQSSVQDKIDSWTNLNLTMSSLGDAVLHFTVTNKMDSIPLYVVMKITLGTNQNNNMDILVSPNKVAIPAGGTASQEYTITFDILDDTINASLTGFKIDIEITPTQPPAEGTQTSTGLKIPTNEQSLLVSEGFMIKTKAEYAHYPDVFARPCTFRVVLEMEKSFKASIDADSTKRLAFLAMPTRFLEQVNPNGYTNIDWITAFKNNGLGQTYMLNYIDEGVVVAVGNNYEYRFVMGNITYTAVNMKISFMGVLETTNADGTKTYQYSKFEEGEDYRSHSRCLGDVAVEALNDRAMGIINYTDDVYQAIEGYVDEYVDLINKMSTPTYDGSNFDFSINMGIPSSFAVGRTVNMEVKVSPNADIPIKYISSNTSVATVDKHGNLTTVGAGTATISVYVSGQVKTVTITVA